MCFSVSDADYSVSNILHSKIIVDPFRDVLLEDGPLEGSLELKVKDLDFLLYSSNNAINFILNGVQENFDVVEILTSIQGIVQVCRVYLITYEGDYGTNVEVSVSTCLRGIVDGFPFIIPLII